MANCQTRHPLRPSVSRHAHPMLDALPPSPFVQPVHFAHRAVTLHVRIGSGWAHLARPCLCRLEDQEVSTKLKKRGQSTT